MFLKDSRYKDARPFYQNTDAEENFSGVRERVIGPTKGVIEHRIALGDRLDLLARHYYNNDRLWWRIIDANPQIMFASDLLLNQWRGQTLLIPKVG
jgi:hypothetical protein